MGLLNRIFGTPSEQATGSPQPGAPDRGVYALERYRYMLQTAPPDTIEQAHAEAFEGLSREQRRQVLAELVRAAPPHERATVENTPDDDPRALARAATRAEIRQPGFMERTLGASPAAGFGPGLLGSFAAGFAGSMVASSFFSALGAGGGAGLGDEAGAGDAELGAHGDVSTAGTDGDLDAAGDYDPGDMDF
ncbi:MAG TPA: hypothetical protein VNN80_07385 [Polyangiaceae bacterium]|jgi:hypothetical protein|nr:hypothetical protein [Polyangiaceae bacterium]